MSKSKIGMGVVEAHKKFDSFDEAKKYAKRLRHAVNYICMIKGYQASVMTVVSNTKKGESDLRRIFNGERGRPKNELVLNKLHKGNCNKVQNISIRDRFKESYY